MLRPLLLMLSLSASLPVAAAPVRVILVGDSTMQGRTGYGDVFCQRFVPGATCINVARGGRSSASFRAEGRWDQVQALLREPGYAATYVLIQFGHNDQPGKPGRSTDLVTDFPRNMARYAAEARELGAVPVLVTPLTRRSFQGVYLHDDLAPWAAATRQVARAGKVALLDLNALSVQAVQAMGQEQADTLAQEGAFDRTHLGLKGATLFSNMVATELQRMFPALGAVFLRGDADASSAIPARETAPADGWAARDGGTQGGSSAGNDHVYTVTNAAELRSAIASGAAESKIIKVAGIIDMRGATPFASTAEQEARATLHIPSNTTLIGIGPHSGFVNAQLRVANVQQVIIRNLHFQNPCDAGPVWKPLDGPTGGWNSEFDSITVSGSTHVWIDHNSFTDAPLTDDKLPVEHGQTRQCHDGALDINKASDFVTVSYNHFALHDKNLLVGSGDNATGDAGHLRISFSNNLFEHVSARAPRVRYGRVHTFNNLHVGDRKHPVYRHNYSIGVGKDAHIISHNNVFDVAGAANCEDIVHHFDRAAAFSDSGSLMNGQPLPHCALAVAADWQIPYAYTLRPPQEARRHVLANAGAGKVLTLPNPVLKTSPAASDAPAPPDAPLRIDFARAPSPGAFGTVRIYRQSDGVLVDTIVPGEEIRALGGPTLDARRYVKQQSVRVRGNSVFITPHSRALAHDQAYFATVDPITRWSFRTAPAPRGTSITVDDDGAADFRTVQGALDHVMATIDKATPVTIEIRNGDYEELLYIRNKDNLTIKGESRDGVVIHGINNDNLNSGSGAGQASAGTAPTGGRALMLIEASDLLTIDTLTMKNDTLRSDRKSGQAETLHFNNDRGRLVVRNASFFSEQDTIQVKGYSWFYRVLVAGNVDFIWGANRVALFEDSEIRSVGDSAQRTSGGWVVQARTVTGDDKGFIFLNSRLTNGPGPGPDANLIAPGSTYLARSPGRETSWDNVAFINCSMDRHIARDGWARDGMNKQPLPNPVVATATRGWREFGSRDMQGQPVRFGGAALTAGDVAQHFGSRAAIFSAWDAGRGWNPQ